MKLNKLIPLSFAALMAAGGLAGCGGGDSDAVIVWATAAEQAVVNKVVEEYNRNATDEEKITVNYKAVAEGDTGTEVAKDPAGKNTADLFLVADDQIYNLQSKNTILDITSAYGAQIKKDNTETSVIGASYNGKVYGFPVTNDNGYFLWYNGDALKDSEVAKLEDLLKVCQDKGKKFLIDIANGWYAPTFFLSPDTCGTDSLRWGENADGDVVYTIKDWDTKDKGVAVANAARSLFDTYENNITTGGNADIVAGFEDGSIIAAVSGTWMLNDLKSKCENLKAAKLPTIKVGTKDCQMGTFTGSKVYCINATKTGDANVAKRAKALKLANALTNRASQLIRFAERATVPCNKEALKDEAYTKNVDIGAKALQAQVDAAAAVQSLSAEGRYWDVGAAIGLAILEGEYGDYADMEALLKGSCNILRNPGA